MRLTLLPVVYSLPVILEELPSGDGELNFEPKRPKWYEIRGMMVSDWDYNDRPYSLINKDTIMWMISKGLRPRKPLQEDFHPATPWHRSVTTRAPITLIDRTFNG